MKLEIRKCDLCKIEYRSDEPRHWSDCISKITLDFKEHIGIQIKIEKDVCTNCGEKLLEALQLKLKELEAK